MTADTLVEQVAEAAAHREPRGNRVAEYIARAKSIAPLIRSESARMERERKVSQEVFDALKENDLLWMLVPEEFGGGGLTYAQGARVLEEIAAADGSTGWFLQAIAGSMAILPGWAGDELISFWRGTGERPQLIAGQLAPRHRARRVDGGYVLDGVWSFASGSDYADLMWAGFFVADENGELILTDGQPEFRNAVFPRSDVKIIHNWDVWGLAGTGSYDYELTELFVPDERTFTLAAPTRRSETFYRLGVAWQTAAPHLGVVLGMARSALEELAVIVDGRKRPLYPSTVGESEIFRKEFAENEALYRSLRSFAFDTWDTTEDFVNDGGEISPIDVARGSQMTTYVQRQLLNVVMFAHQWAGSQSIQLSSSIGRHIRDTQVAIQHVTLDPMVLVNSGRGLLPLYQHTA